MAREVYLVDAAAERTYGEAADQPKFFVNRIYEVVRPPEKNPFMNLLRERRILSFP